MCAELRWQGSLSESRLVSARLHSEDLDVDARRALPQVGRLIATPAGEELCRWFSRRAVVQAARAEVEAARRTLLDRGDAAGSVSIEAILDGVAARLRERENAGLRRAINATGIVLHTNLGRAPLAAEALAAVAEIGDGYSDLELDLSTGRRGSRHRAVADLLCELAGAEAALVVNNNAAAVLLTTCALAAGGEVVVSRGELVEIGGSFRIPDIIHQSGARLVEVGTTNKTRLADYARALTPDTRVLLKVHPSNYRIVGFTGAVSTDALAALGREHGPVVVEDLGSGSLIDLKRFGLPHEPTVPEALGTGADLVTFSGDKLLGGPQAGLIVGRGTLIDRLERHALLRALRPDKLTLAALQATLQLYRDPDRLKQALPVLAMLTQDEGVLQARAERLHALLAGIDGLDVEIAAEVGYAGGGSLPEAGIPTRALRLRPRRIGVDDLASRLQAHRPAVVARIAHDRLVLDLRTVRDDEVAVIGQAVREGLA
jgi:L-seryl-tRNA(Ser) seleniumtransferase